MSTVCGAIDSNRVTRLTIGDPSPGRPGRGIFPRVDLAEFEEALSQPALLYQVKSGEQFVLDRVRELVLDQIPETARTFDWSEFDLGGRGALPLDVVSTARTLPWVSPRRWIWVRGAEASGEVLVEYLKNPSARTTLILEVAGRKPSGWPRIPVIQLKDMDPVRWLEERARSQDHKIERSAAASLVELVGDDFPRLGNELDKLILFTLEEKRIRRSDVFEVCLQTSEADVFELIGALASRKADRALLIAGRLLENGVRLPQILAVLYWNFRRLIVAREWIHERRPYFQIVKELKIWSYKNEQRSLQAVPRQRLVELFLELKRLEVRSKTESIQEQDLLEAFIVDACLKKSL